MANVNTTTTNRNIFTTIGRNTAAIVAAGTLALGLSGCASGNGRNEDVKPLPTPSQIDKPTTDPTTPATQEPSTGNTEPGSDDSCVGQTFLMSNGYSDVKRAIECLNENGNQVTGTGSVKDRDGDGKNEVSIVTKSETFVLGGDGVLHESDYYN